MNNNTSKQVQISNVINLDKFINAYIECAIWSSTDEDGEPLEGIDKDDFAIDAIESITNDCKDFCRANRKLLALASRKYTGDVSEQAGHDFWLTRNGHGAGFWDRGLGVVGKKLTEASQVYGSSDLYVGDDGKVYLSNEWRHAKEDIKL